MTPGTSGKRRAGGAGRRTRLQWRRITAAWRGVRPYSPLVAGAFAISWLLVFVVWLLLPPAHTVEVVIPAGTAERVARGEIVAALPESLRLRRGDTLVIVNEDVSDHRIGPMQAPAGRATEAPVGSAFFTPASLVCSFHPGGAIGLDTQSRPDLLAMMPTVLLLAFPLGAAAAAAMAVTRRLDVGQ